MDDPWRIQSLFELQFFVCPSCNYKHNSKQDFVYHAFNIHPESIQKLKIINDGSISDVHCPWNDIEIKEEIVFEPLDIVNDKDNCQKEEIFEIKEEGDPLDETENEYQNEEDTIQSDDHQCQYCNEIFYDYVNRKKHLRLLCPNLDDNSRKYLDIKPVSSEKCKICGKKYSTNYISRHIREVHTKKRPTIELKCNYCGKEYGRKSTLQEHVSVAHEGKFYQCKECDNRYRTPVALKNHIAAVHQGVKHICQICGMTIKFLHSYKEHMLKHNSIENFQCDVCGKEFVTKIQLSAHNKSHGEKNHVCNICNSAFTTRNILVDHDNKVHKGLKNSQCKICGLLFYGSYQLKKHIIYKHEQHRKVQCAQCDRTFAMKSLLDSHIKNDHVHQNKCDQCSKIFAAKRTLKRHMITVHEGRKDYKCDQCTMAYGQSGDLKRHIIRAHQNVPK